MYTWQRIGRPRKDVLDQWKKDRKAPKKMAAPFVAVLDPDPNDTRKVHLYKVGLPREEQDAMVPEEFIDAMAVRNEVFVKEQGVPAENEYDEDDPRSVHFVAYASINRILQHEVRDDGREVVVPKKSETKALPIGTLRVVGMPAGPHPEKGAKYWAGRKEGPDGLEPLPDYGDLGFEYADRATTFHDGEEHYYKLGRLAVLAPYRGTRIASLLVKRAQEWMTSHPRYFEKSVLTWGLEKLGSKHREVPEWKGLVCVHAQKPVVAKWERWGFEVDDEMGVWWEEGIEHVGMFKRIPVQEEPRKLGIRPAPELSAAYPFGIQDSLDFGDEARLKIANLQRENGKMFPCIPIDQMQKHPEWCRPDTPSPEPSPSPPFKTRMTMTEQELHLTEGLQRLDVVEGGADVTGRGIDAAEMHTDAEQKGSNVVEAGSDVAQWGSDAVSWVTISSRSDLVGAETEDGPSSAPNESSKGKEKVE